MAQQERERERERERQGATLRRSDVGATTPSRRAAAGIDQAFTRVKLSGREAVVGTGTGTSGRGPRRDSPPAAPAVRRLRRVPRADPRES